jgi:hypothetical protein
VHHARFARIGVGEGKILQVESPAQQAALAGGMGDAWKTFKAFKVAEIDTGKRSSADSFGPRAFLGRSYIDRMAGGCSGFMATRKKRRSIRLILSILQSRS